MSIAGGGGGGMDPPREARGAGGASSLSDQCARMSSMTMSALDASPSSFSQSAGDARAFALRVLGG